MKYQNGESFLNHLNQNMHLEEIVMHTASKSDTPEEKIRKYMERLEQTHDMAKDNKHKMNLLKKFYYKKYIIEELPEFYVKLQEKIARERGYGNLEATEGVKKEMLKQIQNDQQSSLDSWIEYLCSDDAMYPMWFKNYAFEGMLKLGNYDKEKGEFKKRTKATTAPYLDLNREVLSQVYNTLSHQIGKGNLSEIEEKALKNGESFKKIYTFFLRKVETHKKSEETEGIWKKYNQGPDYYPLWKSLQGKNTGWCTAGEATAQDQIEKGDFYVYYTKDEFGEYTNPRIAIRMNGKFKIEEIRGIAEDQNLESNMEEILNEKLNEFSDREKYQKKVQDMKTLTTLEKKQKEGQEFTKEELRFLYQIDEKINGFGWKSDPRIEEILQKRDKKKDVSLIFSVPENAIATELSDFETHEKITLFYGDFFWDEEKVPESFSHLKTIIGLASFENLITANHLDSLELISDTAIFSNLFNAKGLKNLKRIGGAAYFNELEDSNGLQSLEYIGGSLYLSSLIDASHLTSLKKVELEANFYLLTNSNGLEQLKYIGKNANFKNLKDASHLTSLEIIEGDAEFDGLVSAKGLNHLKYIGENAFFENLEDATDLISLKNIGKIAGFDCLKSAKGLSNLESIGTDAAFGELIDATGLTSLQSIGGIANFIKLPSSAGLESLETIGEYVRLDSLMDGENLTSLKSIKDLELSKFPYVDIISILRKNASKPHQH